MRSIILALLVVCLPAAAIEQLPPRPLEHCVQHAPFGFPSIKKQNSTKVCRFFYVLEHDNAAKIPAWVSYVLQPKEAIGCGSRKNQFATDQSLKEGERSTSKDYTKSGYDRGHMANSGDMRFSRIAQRESYIMSNIVPQLPGFNRAIWKQLESHVRGWAVVRKSQLLVYMGSIYDYKQDKRIGSGVVVPSAFYKVVVDLKTGEVLAYLFKHEDNRGDPKDHLTSVAEIQRQAGVQLPLPPKATVLKEQWPVESAAEAKEAACSID